MLLYSMVIFPNGTLGRWRPWNQVRSNLISLQKEIYIFWPCFCSFHCSNFVITFNLYFTNVLPMLKRILTFDLCSLFHFLVFNRAYKFNGDLSKWNVGAVTNMAGSTLQSYLPSKRSTIFDHVFALFIVQILSSLLICILQMYCQCWNEFWPLTSVLSFIF